MNFSGNKKKTYRPSENIKTFKLSINMNGEMNLLYLNKNKKSVYNVTFTASSSTELVSSTRLMQLHMGSPSASDILVVNDEQSYTYPRGDTTYFRSYRGSHPTLFSS